MRLDKYAAFAAESRKEIKKLITKGFVTVNGTVIRDCGYDVGDSDEIFCRGKRVVYKKYIYIMMNKPPGVVSATEDNVNPTVTDLLPDEFKRFKPFPVGRLDIDTEGLLLMTNDGVAAHKLLSPRYKVPKKYSATVDGDIAKEDIEKFSVGIVLHDGYKTLPAKLCPLPDGRSAFVTIAEGKFHQIKRMFADCGKHVVFLKRVEFAGICLDETLKNGECRLLKDEEIQILESIMQ